GSGECLYIGTVTVKARASEDAPARNPAKAMNHRQLVLQSRIHPRLTDLSRGHDMQCNLLLRGDRCMHRGPTQ
ncbi:MAG: hypothetical protein ACREX9_08580, partial [Gammaproteobacteria bacterium]